MTTEELQAIRELVNKATPGPWTVGATTDGVVPYYVYGVTSRNAHLFKEDAEFITWCREGVPKLLDEVERLREALKQISALKGWGTDVAASARLIAREALDGDTA